MANNIENKATELRCSFCGKPNSQVKKLIAGPDGVYICDECVEVCKHVISESDRRASKPRVKIKTPGRNKSRTR